MTLVYYVYVCSLSYSARNASESYYVVICGLSGCTVFFHIISEMERLSGGKNVIKNALWFSLQLLSEIFLILRRIEPDKIIYVHTFFM